MGNHPAIPPSLARVAALQQGIVRADQLVDIRLGERQRRKLQDAGLLHRLRRGLYQVGGRPTSFRQRCAHELAKYPGAVLSGRTAARLYHLRKTKTTDVHVISTTRYRTNADNVHLTNLLRPDHITRRHGLAILTPVRLACDLSWILEDDDLESVIEQMLDWDMMSLAALHDLASEYCQQGRAGSNRLRRVLAMRPLEAPPPQSDLELRVWRGLRNRGYELERQYGVELLSGQRIHVDLAEPSLRVAIEIDHAAFHDPRQKSLRDKRRDRGLAAVGWRSIRVTDIDIQERLSPTLDELVVILADPRIA